MRALRPLAVLVVVALALGFPPAGRAGAASSTTEALLGQAQQKAAQARAALAESASRVQAAQSRFDKLVDDVAEVEERIAAHQAEAAGLEGEARLRAVEAYKRRGAEAGPGWAFASGSPLDGITRTELLDRLNDADDTAVKRLGAITEDLAVERERLAARQAAQRAALTDLESERRTLATRLAAADRAERDLAARLARERDAEARAAAAAEVAARQARSTAGGPAGLVIVNPGGAPFVCPVQGPRAFTNDWGQPRSGGRSHQGTDIMAAAGTPNVAVVAGSVTYRSEGLGGLVAYLAGDNGVTYYYAHLSGFAGGARRVSAGEVIGYTGSTGNAPASAPHTHFEIRPGGRGAVNPYPTLAAYC